MSELHLNSQVFDAFQRIASDKTISAKDTQALKQAIEADGQIDDAEQTLLKSLADPEHANSQITISGEGGRKTTFSPAGLHFDGKASAQLKSEFAATEHYSQGISQSWDKIFKAKDGVFDAGDIDKLASQAKTPTDRSLIAALKQGINGGVVTGPDGLMIRTEPHGNGRRIAAQSVKDQVDNLINFGMKARQPDSHALTQLLKALSSPAASVRKAAQEQTKAALSQLTTEERSKLQSVIREHGLQRLSPDFMDQLAGAIKQGQRNDHAKYGEQLGSFLAANEAMEDPAQQAGAYKVLGESLRETGKKAGKSPGEDPNLARFAASMAKAEKSLKDQGVKLTTEQRGIWAEARYATHPHKALAELENIALSPSKESPDQRERSLKFLLEHSPNADEIGQQILAGKGQPSEAMRKLVAQNLHASGADYARMLKDPQSEVRIEALQGLSKFPSVETVKLLKEYYTHHAVAGQEQLSTRYSLSVLSASSDKAVAAAANQAIKEIAEIDGREFGPQPAGPAPAAGSLASLESLLQQQNPPYDRILQTLNDPQLRKAATTGLVTQLEQAAAQDQADGLKGRASANRIGQLENKMLEALGKIQPAQAQKSAREQFQKILATYTDPPKVEKALQRAQWLSDPILQAQVIEAAGKQFPKDAALKTWLSQNIDHGKFAPEQKLALERARLTVDPATATKDLTRLLQKSDALPLEGKRQLLSSLLTQAKAHPELSKGFSPLLTKLAAGQDEVFSQPALEGLKAPQWQNRDFYKSLLESPNQPVRRAGLAGLGELAKKGDVDAVHALNWHATTSPFVNEKGDVDAILSEVAEAGEGSSDPKLAAAAGKAQERLGELADTARENRVKSEPDRRELEAANKAHKVFGSTISRYLDGNSDEREWIADSAFSGPQPDLGKYGLPIQKAGYARMMLDSATDKPSARRHVLEIFNSTKNRQEFDEVMNTLRASRQNPHDLQSFLDKDQYASFMQHRQELYDFKDKIDRQLNLAMSAQPAEKAKFLGELIEHYRQDKLGPAESQDAIGHLLGSIGDAKAYGEMITTLRADKHFDESSLIEVVGDKAFDEFRERIGIEPAVTNYTDDEKLAKDAQDFFDFVSTLPLKDDDYLSTNNLVKNHPEIRDWPFFRHLENGSLDERGKIAELIAKGKVNVAGVQPYFADRYLFHKLELGVFELSGDFHLKDFLSGSVADKARQFVAIDKVAQMIHDTTKQRFEAQETKLRSLAASPAQLGAKLAQLQAGLKPYQSVLGSMRGSTAGQVAGDMGGPLAGYALKQLGEQQMATLKAMIKAEQAKAGGPPLSDTQIEIKIQQLRSADALLDRYGSDGAKAAAKMVKQADALAQTAAEMGVAGDYQQDRIEFRKKAFALYNNKDMDMLHAAYVEGMQGLGPDAAKVVQNATKLEDEISTYKGYAKTAAHLVATMTGVDLALQVGELAIHVGETYRDGKLVDDVRRSSEAQEKAWRNVAFEAVMVAANIGFKGYQGKVEKEIEAAAEAEEKFAAVKGLDRAMVKKMDESESFGHLISPTTGQKLTKEEAMKLLDAKDVFIKNAKEVASRNINSLKAVVETMAMAGTDQPPAKIFANLLVKGTFHQAVKKLPASEQPPFFGMVTRQLLGPGVTQASKGLQLLEDGDTPLTPTQRNEAAKYLTELRKTYPNLNLPASVDTEQAFSAALAKVAAAGEPQTLDTP